MFEFIKNTSLVSGISKGFSSVAGYFKSIDYKSKLGNTRTAVSGLFSAGEMSEKEVVIEEDIIGCVGKLPVYADFIRLNLSVNEALELDKWIQKGFMFLTKKRMEAFKQVFNQFPDLSFILFGNNKTRTVAGVMVPGQDQSGREFPFVIFNILGQHFSPQQISLLPLMVDEFQQSALKICGENWDDKDKKMLIEQINQLPKCRFQEDTTDLQQKANNLLDLHTAESFWQAILPDAGVESRAEYIQIFNRKIQETQASGPETLSQGIEINIVDFNKSKLVQLFVIYLLERMFTGSDWKGQSWLYETTEGNGRLIIYLRPLHTNDLLTLVDYESGHSNLVIIEDLLCESVGELQDELKILDNDSELLITMADNWVELHNKLPEANNKDVPHD